MIPTLYLVACAAQKRAAAAPAGDLYTSDLFRKARAVAAAELGGRPLGAEAFRGAWRILSARHGVLHPLQIVEPYNQTLSRMTAAERRAWGARVAGELAELLELVLVNVERVVFLAGEHYRAGVAEELARRGYAVEAPLAGLGIGRQKQWLNRRLETLAAAEERRIDAA